MSLSAGTTSACEGHIVTNFIPATLDDVLRVKGLTIAGTQVNSQWPKICTYTSTKANLGGKYGATATGADNYGNKVSIDGDVSTCTLLIGNDGSQLNKTGVAYIRIDGILMDGYTSNDVIITINEEIPQPVTVDIALTDGIRIDSDGTDRTLAGFCATEMIDLRSIPKPCTINLTEAKWCSDGSTQTVRYYVADASGTALDANITIIGTKNYFTLVDNSGDYKDVTITVTSSDVGYIRFSGQWGGTGTTENPATFENVKATLTYTPN